jgi:hypothetical protein
MKQAQPIVLGLVGAGLLALSCASSPPPRAEALPPRIKDSVPEKIAAQRGADRTLQLEAEDQRWGVDAARERRAETASKKEDLVAAPPKGPVDLSRGAKGPPPPASQPQPQP